MPAFDRDKIKANGWALGKVFSADSAPALCDLIPVGHKDADQVFIAVTHDVNNKGAPGADGISIEKFPKWVRPQWNQIKKQLLAGAYKPSAAFRVEIPKESGGVRRLGIPRVLDRVLMQAMAIRLGESSISPSQTTALAIGPSAAYSKPQDELRDTTRKVTPSRSILIWSNFFETVNHDVLLERIGRRVKKRPTEVTG
jgi:RNA-directed DNA polymerase